MRAVNLENLNRSVLVWAALAAPVSSVAMAQCEPHWLPGEGIRGLDGPVSALASWDPDGPGPLLPRMLAGGSFTIAGNAFASNLAAWDPQTQSWFPVGGGIGGRVEALATLPDGTIYAGGNFSSAGGIQASRIAKWDPVTSAWSSLGSGMSDDVSSLAVLPSGEVVAAGFFTTAGGISANRIAKWNPASATWTAFGSGMNNWVAALAVLPGGDIVAGGRFSMAGGSPAANIARWNAASGVWSPLGSGTGNSLVSAVLALPSGDVIAGGTFATAGGNSASRIARWNSAAGTWSALGSGISGSPGNAGSVLSLSLASDGGIIAGGAFAKAGDQTATNIARWDLASSTWSPMMSGLNNTVRSLLVSSTDIIAGGDFAAAGSTTAQSIARWDSTLHRWSAFGSNPYGTIQAMVTLPDGDVVASRAILDRDNSNPVHVAEWNAATSTWSSLGSGMNGTVTSLALAAGGDVIAGGGFSSAGGVPVSNVARWSASDSAWKPMGAGFSLAVFELAASPTGDIIAGGELTRSGTQIINGIARWDESSQKWLPLGSGLTRTVGAGAVNSIAFLPDGDIVVGGEFSFAGGTRADNIARWDTATSTWLPIGTGLASSVGRVIVLESGAIIASTRDRVFRWNESTAQWTRLGVFSGGLPSVYALLGLNGGDFLVAGSFNLIDNGQSAHNLARWSSQDSKWYAIEPGPTNALVSPPVYALTNLPDGFAVGGNFIQAGETISAYFARYVVTGSPWVAEQPAPATLIAGDTLTLHSTPAAASSGVMARWQRFDGASEFVDLVDGPGGASPGGGTVYGSFFAFPSPTDGTPTTLQIEDIQHSDAGLYRVEYVNECGESASVPVEIKVKAHITDINADGQVDDADFVLFVDQYNIMLCADPLMPDSCSADFNHDGVVDDADFEIFVPAFDAMLF